MLTRQTRRHVIKSWIMKELLRTTDPTVLAFATALLDAEGIAVFQMDVHMSVLEGSIGILPRRMMVRDADLVMARAILKDNGIDTDGGGVAAWGTDRGRVSERAAEDSSALRWLSRINGPGSFGRSLTLRHGKIVPEARQIAFERLKRASLMCHGLLRARQFSP